MPEAAVYVEREARPGIVVQRAKHRPLVTTAYGFAQAEARHYLEDRDAPSGLYREPLVLANLAASAGGVVSGDAGALGTAAARHRRTLRERWRVAWPVAYVDRVRELEPGVLARWRVSERTAGSRRDQTIRIGQDYS